MQIQTDPLPIVGGFNRGRRIDRDISEMLGFVKGMLAGGKVTDDEAVLLHNWGCAHPDVVDVWPGNVLMERLHTIFEDGVVSEEERSDLASLLAQIVGGQASVLGDQNLPTKLPLDDPPPEIQFNGSVFVFTGKFAFGPRKVCEAQVVELYGVCKSNVNFETDYLVLGTFGSRNWIQTSHGRKIERAVELREQGKGIAIISEDHWAMSFDGDE